MTLPVSTSGRDSLGSLPGERGGGSVRGGVAGYAVEPAAVDDADPGAGEYAGGVRMVLAAGAGIVADLRGPGAGVPAVVGEGGDRDTEPLAAGPAEVHGPVLAGLPGDGGAAGEGGDGAGVPAGLPGIAPLGEHPGSVDLTRPGQRREDRAVRVLHEVGAMERSRFFTEAFKAMSTPAAASTASRSASVSASRPVPAGAERSRAGSPAAVRRPE